MSPTLRGLNILQKISMSLMAVLVLITFVGANLHALLWQSSAWLVSTVLPAVVVNLTNEERAENLAQPLQRNTTLDKAAKLKAEHMAKNEYFSHFSPEGISPWYWFDEAGYVYAHAGENLAIHFTDSSEVVEAWMDSPTHRQNIVNGLYTEIGVGTAKGKYEGYDTVYVVQLFGTPAIPPTTKIKGEPSVVVTNSPTVVATESVLDKADKASITESSPDTFVSSELKEDSLELKPDTNSLPENVIISELATEEVLSEFSLSESVILVDTESEVEESTTDIQYTTKENITISDPSEVVIIESPVISTSSGLVVAQVATQNSPHAGATISSVITQPNTLLRATYLVLTFTIVLLLSASVVIEARRFRLQQVAYGVLLLIGMGGLLFINSILTTGAVIV